VIQFTVYWNNLTRNVQWISIPLQIGDPIPWRHLASDVWKNYRHPDIAVADTVAKDDFRRWIAGKRYIPQQRSPRKGTYVGCPLGDGKSVGAADRFSWPVGWSQIGYPKKRVFFDKFDLLVETFLECETMCRKPPPGHVFVGSLAEIDPRKVAEVVPGAWFTSQKNNASATHFFALSQKPIARFRWKRARLSLFRPQPHTPSFIQIHPSFRDLLAKTMFQIATIIGDRR